VITATLSPIIDDDGWSGTPTYAWSQVSGAASTIVSPTAASTDVQMPDVPGVYVFQVTVTNDAFSSDGFARVVVLAPDPDPGDPVPEPDPFVEVDIKLLINDVERRMQENTLSISENGPGQADVATFKVYDFVPEAGQLVQIYRIPQGSSEELIFAGVITQDTHSYAEHREIGFDDVNAIDWSWFITRRLVFV